ncbi:MAG: ATP-binding protein, partial [Acidobacterium ailaaui]|nr:ATP-binding protein [Pseudacidobacterium ailaaui]
ENTVITDLRYVRHDIYSLHTDATEQTSPIAAVLSVADDLAADDDFARLSVCAETMSRRQWAKIGGYAHEKLAKGKRVERARLSPQKMARSVRQGATSLFNEVSAIITDIMKAFENVFYKKEAGTADFKAPTIEARDDKYDRLSTQSQNKRYQPVWRTRIRIAVHSQTPIRRDLIASTIAGAFSELSADNELTAVRVKRNGEIIRELNELRLSARSKADGDVNLLSCDELAKVALQMPTREVQARHEEALAVNRKVEVEVPAIFRKDHGIYIGIAEAKGEQIPIYIPVSNPDELYRTYVFQGSQGTGKDTAIKNFVVDACLNHGISAVIPDAIMEDGARGMADGIRDALPPDRVIDIDLSDAEWPVPLDLTEVVRKLGHNGANRFAQEMIDFFGDLESMGQSRTILREFAKASNGSIIEIKRLIENDEYRMARVEELRGEGRVRLADSLAKWKQSALDAKGAAVLYRLDELLGDDLLFNIFAQPPNEAVDFERWIAEGKVVILRVPNRKIGTLAAKTLIHWITLKTFMTKLLMDGQHGCFIVFNEPHQYMTPGLERLLQRLVLEGRKWRIGSLFAFHHIGLLPRTFADDLQASGTNWFLFANTHKGVYERLSEELAPNFDVESAMATERFHAICLLQFGGRRQAPFLCRMAPPPAQSYDNAKLTREHSRIYGRHITEVERLEGIAAVGVE